MATLRQRRNVDQKGVSEVKDVASPDSVDTKKDKLLPIEDKFEDNAPFWYSFTFIFIVIDIVRTIGTLHYSLINDCDETFNYWEPLHYILYGRGLQTWEYSPEFALRSYAYLDIYGLLALMSGAVWGVDKLIVFHRVRLTLTTIYSVIETFLVLSVTKRFGKRIGFLTLLTSVGSAGLIHAVPAFLPSTFTMYMVAAAFSAYLFRRPYLSVTFAAVGVLLGWPFAIVALVPLALSLISGAVQGSRGGLRPLILLFLTGVTISALVLGISAYIDKQYYHSWLSATWNIVKYNAFGVGGGGQGADLYGTEPVTYFFANLTLNFNLLFPLALISILLILIDKKFGSFIESTKAFGSMSTVTLTFVLWFATMSAMSHKEERFMFVVYPLIPICASISLSILGAWLTSFLQYFGVSVTSARFMRRSTLFLISFIVILLSLSRTMAMVKGYSAPFTAYSVLNLHLRKSLPSFNRAFQPVLPRALQLSSLLSPVVATIAHFLSDNMTKLEDNFSILDSSFGSSSEGAGVRVCVGKEWYRFPSSFFLPEFTKAGAAAFPNGRNYVDGGHVEIEFFDAGFDGQLPRPFLDYPEGLWTYQEGFNDMNVGDKDRFVDIDTCDYIVDYKLPHGDGESENNVNLEKHFQREFFVWDQCVCDEDASESDNIMWYTYWSLPMTDPSSGFLGRAFYIPKVSEKYTITGNYVVMRKINCCLFDKENPFK